MEIKPNVIIYFPYGAAGNLVANIFSLDTNFMFFDNSKYLQDYPKYEDRYKFIKEYYQVDVNNKTWLAREWSIRTKPTEHFYSNNSISYWDPRYRLTYLIHGKPEEIRPVLSNNTLFFWDRSGIHEGRATEVESPWTIQECDHIFILPNDIDNITDIYMSKHQSDLVNRTHQIYKKNRLHHSCLIETKQFLLNNNRRVLECTAENLFKETGGIIIKDIAHWANVNVPANHIEEIHSIWLRSTRILYYNTFNKELIL